MRSPLLFALALAGCSSPPLPVELPPPGPGGALFVAVVADGTTTLHAVDRASAAGLPTIDDAPESLDVYALEYADALDTFGVSRPGPVATTRAAESFALPAEGSFSSARVEGDEAGAWQRLDALPSSLAALKLPGRRDPCRRYKARQVRFPAGVNGAARIDDRTALVVTDSGPFFRISMDDLGLEPVQVPSDRIARAFAHRDTKGKLWLFGERGSASAYDPASDALTELPSMDDDELAFADDGDDDPDGRFWVLGMRAVFDAFEGGTWVEHPHDLHRELRDWARGIAEQDGVVITTNHEPLAGMPTPKMQVYARDGARTELELPGRLGAGAARTVPGLGMVVAATDGTLYRFRPPSTFEPLPNDSGGSPFVIPIYAITHDRGTLFLGGGSGAMGQYRVGLGYCPDMPVTGTAIEAIVPLGDDLLVVEDGVAWVTILSRE